MKIVFMGTPDFAAGALRAILDSHHQVVCAYTQPPRPKGRGQQLQKSPVHILAESAGIPVRHPVSFKKDPAAIDDFAALGADVAVVAAYGLILPQVVLDAPRFGCVNIHASLLPRWRGASPIQRAIMAGDSETGITLMVMEAGLDTGPVLERRSMAIDESTTATSLHDGLRDMGADMIVPFLDRLSDTQALDGVAQDDALSCYAALLKKEDGRVDWTRPASEIDRQIRALNPWPGVWAVNDRGQRLKILSARMGTVPSQDSSAAPGMVLDRDGCVVCGGGTILILEQVQPENARAMDVRAAINGGYIVPGETLPA